MLKYLNVFRYDFSDGKSNPDVGIHRKGVIKMADKKNPCGCGCIPLKQNSTKVTKDEKKAKVKNESK